MVKSSKPSEVAKSALPSKPPRSWLLAIIASIADVEFPELLRSVKRGVNSEVTGNSISKMRRTGKGELLIEIHGGADSAEVVRAEVTRSLGAGAKVRKMVDTSPIEIRDLDEEATKDEVLNAVAAYAGDDTAQLVSMRKIYGGAQSAIVFLPSTAARRLCAEGRVRVGLVYARVRSTELRERCFKCLGFRHVSRTCSATDRSACYFRCGAESHFFRECTASQDAAATFRATVSGPEKRDGTVANVAANEVASDSRDD